MPLDLGKYGQPVSENAKGLDLGKYGTPVVSSDVTNPKQDGFFKGVYKSIFTPVVNLIARPGQAVQSALGYEPSTGEFAGLEVTSPKGFKDVLRDVGKGLETVSLAIGGTGTAKAGITGLRQGIKEGVKEGAIVGLKSSPVFGAGQSLDEGNTDIKQILADAAEATALGVPTTAAFGALGPAVTGTVKKFTKNGLREEVGNIFRETSANYVKPQAILDQAYQVKQTDPIAVLQMYGKNIIPDMRGNGADTTEAQEFLKMKIKELATLRNEDLFLSNERVPLGGFRQYANELLDAQNWSQSKKDAVRKDLTRIFDGIDNSYKNSPKLADGGIDLNELTTLKTEQTGLSKSYNNKAPKFDYDAHGIAGKAARDLVELLTDSPTVKDLNKLMESHYDAIDLLKAINGKKVHGGAFSKAFLKLGGDIIGATAGTSLGNPIVGGVAGHLVASKVADIIQSRFITNPVKRMLINNLKEQTPKEVNAVLRSLEKKYKNVFDDIFPDGVAPSTTSKKASGEVKLSNKEEKAIEESLKRENTDSIVL